MRVGVMIMAMTVAAAGCASRTRVPTSGCAGVPCVEAMPYWLSVTGPSAQCVRPPQLAPVTWRAVPAVDGHTVAVRAYRDAVSGCTWTDQAPTRVLPTRPDRDTWAFALRAPVCGRAHYQLVADGAVVQWVTMDTERSC